MIVESAQYLNDRIVRATINGVERDVPVTELNVHYKAIQEWVGEGNTIEEA